MPAAGGSQADPALAALRGFGHRHPGLGAAPVAIAFSGGADSTALLLAAMRLWGPQQLRALHVHHGLQAGADAFAEHVLQQCALWRVPCTLLPVQVQLQRGDSVEDMARDARYQALGKAALEQGCRWLLLGHQADDQVESLLLALLRGAGPKGLAAMPEAVQRGGLWLGRPLLACAAGALRKMLDTQAQPYLRDPMNADPAFRRSRIRHELLPVLAGLEPGWRNTLARSAALCAQAASSVEAMAAMDLAQCAATHGTTYGASHVASYGTTAAAADAASMATSKGLRLVALRALSDARLSEVLRLWLRQAGLRSNHGQIDNLRRQVRATAQGAAALSVKLGAATVERHGINLVLKLQPG
jgi:tRNA(Ile)-lysidine synthase